MYRTLACNFTTIGLRCFPAKFPKVSKKAFLQNIFGRVLLKLAIFGEWFEKEYVLKNTCHAPKNLKRRLPVVINKKPENQHNFQRVKQHAVNDGNIHHEESHLRNRRKIKRIKRVTAFRRELGFVNLIAILPTQLLDWNVFLELPQKS